MRKRFNCKWQTRWDQHQAYRNIYKRTGAQIFHQSRRQRGGIQQLSYWGPRNIRRHRTKFSPPNDLEQGFCTLPCKRGVASCVSCRVPLLYKGKGKVLPRTGHEGSQGEQMYSYTLPSTSALDGGGWSTPHPGRFTSRKNPVPIV